MEKSGIECDGMVVGGQIVSATTTKLSLEGSSSKTSADAPRFSRRSARQWSNF
jgi:hypothetical protein